MPAAYVWRIANLMPSAVDDVAVVNRTRCVGCGVCVNACPDHALVLVRRPEDEIKPVPVSIIDWANAACPGTRHRFNPPVISVLVKSLKS